MSITIDAPDIETRLREGADASNVSVEDYTVGVLRAALDALASAPGVLPSVPSSSSVVPALPSAFSPLASLDEDELEDRRQSAEYLRRALDEARSLAQPIPSSEKPSRS